MSEDIAAITLEADALLLDLDGTLVDSGPDVERMWRAWCEKEGVNADELLAVSEGRQGRSVVEQFAPHLDPRQEDAWIIDFQLKQMRDTHPVPGAAEFLSSLGTQHWAIVTSCTRALAEARLDICGLPRPVVMVPADEIDRGKPDPEGFLTGASKLGKRADRCVVFEDSVAGIEAGRAAGMRTVVLTGATRDAAEADHAIADWTAVRVEGTAPWRLVMPDR